MSQYKHNKNPRISILVPIYGTEQYIKRCAQSLFKQTYDNIEFVFVNDATKDNSISILNEVIKEYPQIKNSIKIINHQKNRGLAAARKTALNNATGDYIMHVDSDDFLPFDSVDKLVEAANKGNYDIINGSYQIYSNHKLGNIMLPYTKSKDSYIRNMISKLGIVPNNIWGRLIKKDLYINNNINAIEGIDFSEDYCVLPKLLYYANITSISDVVYFYNTENLNSYLHNYSVKSLNSDIKASIEVYNFFLQKKKYLFSAELGMTNLYKVAIENDLLEQLNKIKFSFNPTFFILWIYKVAILNKLVSRYVFSFASKCYKLFNK